MAAPFRRSLALSLAVLLLAAGTVARAKPRDDDNKQPGRANNPPAQPSQPQPRSFQPPKQNPTQPSFSPRSVDRTPPQRDTGPQRDTSPKFSAPKDTSPKFSGPKDVGPKSSGPRDTRSTTVFKPPTDRDDNKPRSRDPNPRDTGPKFVQPKDTGPKNPGPRDVGPKNLGPKDSGPKDLGPKLVNPRDTGPKNLGPKDTGPKNLGPRDTSPRDPSRVVSPRDTGPKGLGPKDTVPKLGPNAGPKDAGIRDLGPKTLGPNNSGPKTLGPRNPGGVGNLGKGSDPLILKKDTVAGKVKVTNPRHDAPRIQVGKDGKLGPDDVARLQSFRKPGGGNLGPDRPNLGKIDPTKLTAVERKNLSVDKTFVNVVAPQRVNAIVGTKSAAAIGFKKQLALYPQGDVVRPAALYTPALMSNWRANRFYGAVGPNFASLHFAGWYPGPGFYPAYSWYPRWNPWVSWAWWNTVPIWYDPRPWIVRPFYYPVAPAWAYYDYPVWQPLPVVASGTWVDASLAAVPQGNDLQLLAVRFVDPGHPEHDLGPRYRAWVYNASKQPVEQFNVMMFASNNDQLNLELPQAGVTVPSMEAEATQAIDVRLPIGANNVGRDEKGRKVPFSKLHVVVDSHNDVQETDEKNNGAILARTDVLPVDPAAFSADVTEAAPGDVVSIAGEGLGPEPGKVLVYVEGLELQGEIEGWFDLGVRVKLPNLPVAAPVDAEIVVVRGDKAAANPIALVLNPEAVASAPIPEPEPGT